MKPLFSILSTLFLCSLLFYAPIQPLYAHDIIPPALSEYLVNNPNATPEEIKAVASTLGAGGIDTFYSAPTSFWEFSLQYTKLGIKHILTGADHILFLIALLLLVKKLRHVLKVSITFTIAHSITFILAGTTAMSVSGRIVEPMIALSIAIVALMSLQSRSSHLHHSLLVVFILGLFHGLGFAGLLSDLQIPTEAFLPALLLFNVGIEVGQLAIVSVAYPLLFLLRSRSDIWRFTHLLSVSCLAVIGFIWAIERLF